VRAETWLLCLCLTTSTVLGSRPSQLFLLFWSRLSSSFISSGESVSALESTSALMVWHVRRHSIQQRKRCYLVFGNVRGLRRGRNDDGAALMSPAQQNLRRCHIVSCRLVWAAHQQEAHREGNARTSVATSGCRNTSPPASIKVMRTTFFSILHDCSTWCQSEQTTLRTNTV
jgi:hypothetical protein